jgi:hypothetical protein
VHALIGHSAGAMTMMAARATSNLKAQHYVCISSPSYPHPPVTAVRQRLKPRTGVMAAYQQEIARQFHTDWEALEAGRAYEGAGSDLLLFYDRKDRYVDHSDGDRILNWCAGARLVKTDNYGHIKVLDSPELLEAVKTFISTTDQVNAKKPN